MVDTACNLLERAAGVKLHRDPISEKVKFLPLGRWMGTLTQEDLPKHCQYITLSDHLDFLGVELRATSVQTKKVNGRTMEEWEVHSTHNRPLQGLVQVLQHQLEDLRL